AELSVVSENKRVASDVLDRFGHVDLLLNVAGVLSKERQTTSEGNELTLATNLLGPIALTKELKASRTVMTGSGAINFVKDVKPNDLQSEQGYDGFRRAYARSKAYLTLWALTSGKELNVAVADPGGTQTDMTLDEAVPLPIRLLRPLIMHSPQKAARAFVDAGHTLSADQAPGLIVTPSARKTPPQRFLDAHIGRALDDQITDLIGAAG
ncbi:MAG: SDR family NAD(P)-dependent oxidoreductase, partial [Devosiaceae bacterium]|nr:SDR family NAD(P)-dependent oxidoreductase [Devosiaceae bacterium MH13]